MTSDHLQSILTKHVPKHALSYCIQLWEARHFQFKLSTKRNTKVGDFTCRDGRTARITVNEDLQPHLFLITYIHEVAHFEVHCRYGPRKEAHGAEWKAVFRKLMEPVMYPEIFPLPLLSGLAQHMVNPKASTFSDAHFTQLLRQHDPMWSQATLLSEIPEGSVFGLHGRWFKKGALQRTRVLCQEVRTKKKFLVPADASVEGVQLSLLRINPLTTS